MQTSINSETAARAAADTTLQNNINAEALARQQGDAAALATANLYADTVVNTEPEFHHHWLGTVHIHLRWKRKIPEQLAVFNRDPHGAFPADPDNLFAAGERSQNGRSVSRAVAERSPNGFAGEPVIRHDAFAVRATGRDDYFFIHDQRRTGHRPVDVVRAVVRQNIFEPF